MLTTFYATPQWPEDRTECSFCGGEGRVECHDPINDDSWMSECEDCDGRGYIEK